MSLLAEVMGCPARLDTLTAVQWDSLLRFARFARLGGRLQGLVEERGMLDNIPDNVRDVLMGARTYTDYMQLLARRELLQLETVFADANFPVVLLKGAAYIFAELPVAPGRGLNDIDILVPRASLDETEELLFAAGWRFEDTLTDYDHRYYRQWSHELPPMRHSGSRLELDVHHNLIQPTSRIKLDSDLLFRSLVAVPGTRFFILSPADMVLHAATHLFMSDELRGGLRDLVDMHMLCNHFAATETDYWEKLSSRAKLLGLLRPLYYAAAAMRRILGTVIPGNAWGEIAAGRPGWLVDQVMRRVIDRHLAPACLNDAQSWYARRILYVRSHWIRMPPLMLLRHLAYKWWLGLQGAGQK